MKSSKINHCINIKPSLYITDALKYCYVQIDDSSLKIFEIINSPCLRTMRNLQISFLPPTSFSCKKYVSLLLTADASPADVPSVQFLRA